MPIIIRCFRHMSIINLPFLQKNRPCIHPGLLHKLVAAKKFNQAIEHILSKDNPILIYPEAHLWPYYTKIRPFDNKSFRYPVNLNKPVFTFTTTYHKRKHSKKPKIVIYVDGPFYPDRSLDKKSAMQKLRDEVYQKMCERAKLSDYEFVKYVKRSKDD